MARRPRVTATKDPLAPVETIVQVTLTFVAAAVCLVLVVAGIQLASTGSTDLTIGTGDEHCATFDPSGGGTGGNEVADITALRPEVRAHATRYEICTDDPTPLVRVLGLTSMVGSLLLLLGVPFLLYRLVGTARRAGLFSMVTAVAVRRFGWVLLGLAVLGPIVRSVANGVVLSTLIDGRGWAADLGRSDFSWGLLVTALGVITVGRVLAHAVVLQEDVDATI